MSVYERAHATVDEHFARFGSKSYAINKITSVDVRENVKTSAAWLISGLVGLFLTLVSLGMLSDGIAAGAIFLVAGIGLTVLAFFLHAGRESRSYVLLLATAAGEVQATTSNDREAIAELRGVIERRMAGSIV